MSVRQPLAEALPLAFEVVERVLQAGDGAERRHRHRQLDLVVRAGSKQRRGVAVAVFPKTLAAVLDLEAADRCDDRFACLLELHQRQDLLQQRPARELALGVAVAGDRHGERVARRRDAALDVLPDLCDAAGRKFDVAFGVADLPPHGVLVVDVGSAQPFEPGDVGFQARLQHKSRIARRDGLGHRKLVGLALAHVLETADRRVARKRGRNEAGLALVVLPHLRVEAAFSRVGEDVDLVVLVALAHDAALALLDLRRQPGHVEVVQCLQTELSIDASPHRLRRADQEADLAGPRVAEQALLRLGLLVFLHKGDLGRGHAHANELVADPAVGREAT